MTSSRLKILVPLGFLVLAGIVTFALVQARPVAERAERAAEAPLVRVMEVQVRNVPVAVTSQGTVAPRIETTLASQVSGRIESVSPKFAGGGIFRAGEVILQLERRDYEVAAAQAEAAIAQAKLALSRESAEAQIARQEWETLGSGEPGALVLREPQLAQARAALAAAEASLMQARLNMQRTTIRAPFDGIILDKHADLGGFVAPGTPLARIAASDYVEVELPVTSEDLAHLDLASSPAVTLTSGTGGVWQGTIVRVGGRIDPKTRMLPLVARVDRPFVGRQPLRLGEFVTAVLEGRTAERVIEIPRAALRRGDQVLVVDAGGKLRFRPITVARISGDRVLVASGLASGEKLVLSAMETPVEGMTVRTVVETPAEEVRIVEP